MSEHTPGPWKARGSLVFLSDLRGGFDLSYCPDPEANATLCAASPDLLEALTECLEEMKTYSHVAHPGGVAGAELFNERLSKAFAAIHKARGEQ